ncbi:MAG: ribonuclease E/G [Alphaproteobacteria bacterium]|nr:ribonuclease E/G [Alphaproteobacteria bacterium]
MTKRMLIDALHLEETRVAIADKDQIYDFDFVSTAKRQVKGNIYLAKITRVEPSLQAAFVEYGGGKQGFLPFSEIHADYYQIPVSDRKRLLEEAAREVENDDEPDASEANYLSAEARAQAQGESLSGENVAATDEPDVNDVAIDEASSVAALPLAPAIEVRDASTPEAEDELRPIFLNESASQESVSEVVDMPELVEGAEPVAAEAVQDAPFPESSEAPEVESRSSEGDEGGEEVETIANDEEMARPKRNQFHKRYKIQEVIRRGQIVLVQVIKEERGNKGVSLTTYLSLAGRYCVLMPNSPKDGGISRKIASADDRKRLKAISTELRLAQGMSVIIRTAGMDRSHAEIKRDFDYLVKLWNMIREQTLKSTAPALVYEESDIIKRAIRDQYSNDIEEILVEGEAGYRTAKDFMKMLLPSHAVKVQHYKEATPIFYAYNIEDQLLSMHDPVVKLRSGGYIVINPTEALISIDVNSGRSTGERNIEETALKTNLETANEVARQLRLRDLAGLIVIDFIDMMESRNRRAVEKTLRDALKADRAKIQLGRISPFGLLEMSRQRLRPSISETNMVQCPHCVGRGFIRSNESMSIQVIRSVEKEAANGSFGVLRVVAPQSVALHLLNTKRDVLRAIEERYNVTVTVTINPDPATSDFSVEKMRRAQGEQQQGEQRRGRRDRGERGGRDRDRSEREPRPERESAPMPTYDELPEGGEEGGDNIEMVQGENNNADNNRRGGRNRRRRGGRRDGRPNVESQNVENAESAEAQNAETSEGGIAPAEGEPRPRRERGERGGRGRRRWRDDRGHRPEGSDNVTGQPMPVDAPSTQYPAPYIVEKPASSAPVIVSSFAPAAPAPRPAAVVESTPRDPAAPPKKGWWKKMIDLE